MFCWCFQNNLITTRLCSVSTGEHRWSKNINLMAQTTVYSKIHLNQAFFVFMDSYYYVIIYLEVFKSFCVHYIPNSSQFRSAHFSINQQEPIQMSSFFFLTSKTQQSLSVYYYYLRCVRLPTKRRGICYMFSAYTHYSVTTFFHTSLRKRYRRECTIIHWMRGITIASDRIVSFDSFSNCVNKNNLHNHHQVTNF